jgi:hypothetical protein
MRMSLIFIGFLWLLSACAIQSAPEGGPKDETAPGIIKTIPPNQSINFSANEIVIEFDEFVQLKNFTGQFFSSPPLNERIDFKLKGKKLYLYLNEELKENTTYTFNFGAAIEDITENNVQADFKYVFATGEVLDSLAISGTVQDAYSGKAEEGMIAMLYPKNTPDTTLLKSRPAYYALTDEFGNFSIENLALDTFKIVVIKDENLNLMYDARAEKAGFSDVEAISGYALAQPIRTYREKGKAELIEATQKGYGKILLSFSNNIKNPEVTLLGGDVVPNKREESVLELAGGGDSVYYWYNAKQYPEDMNFVFLNVVADSLQADSVRVLLQDAKAPQLKLDLTNSKSFSPLDTAYFESPVPIKSIDEKGIRVEQDSVPVPFQLTQKNDRVIGIWFDKKPGTAYAVYFDKEGLTDLFGRMNDSLVVKAKVVTEEDMAILIMNLAGTDSIVKIFELINETGDVVRRETFTDQLVFTQDYVIPGSYGIRIIWDINTNGQWDAGNYGKKVQPEAVLYYPKPIELRANWELEVEWEIPEP